MSQKLLHNLANAFAAPKTKSKSEIRIPACHAFKLVFLLGVGGIMIILGIAIDLLRGIAGRSKLETNSNSK